MVVVTSRPAGEGRAFAVEPPKEGEEPKEGEAPTLPEDLARESDLVAHMRESGYQLTMVGGGSRPEEVRRFYFRPA